jgi:type II secretory pathway component PulC
VKKEQVQLAVIGVGLVVLGFFLLTNLKPAKRQAGSPAPVADSSEPSVPGGAVKPRGRDTVTALQSKRWEAAWGRDPFLSMSDSTGKLNEFELKGISFSRDKKGYAFINNQIVSAGDRLGGYEVTRIEKDRVMLTRGTQTFFLTFSEQ